MSRGLVVKASDSKVIGQTKSGFDSRPLQRLQAENPVSKEVPVAPCLAGSQVAERLPKMALNIALNKSPYTPVQFNTLKASGVMLALNDSTPLKLAGLYWLTEPCVRKTIIG